MPELTAPGVTAISGGQAAGPGHLLLRGQGDLQEAEGLQLAGTPQGARVDGPQAALLAIGARIIVTAAHHPAIVFPARNYYTHDISVRCFAISNAAASDLAAAARVINSRLADHTLRPRIGARLPLTAAAEAHRRQEAGHAGGRIVVLP